MKSRLFLFLAAASCVLLAPHALLGHHGTAGYDMSKVITVRGTVTQFEWSNPHCVIYVDAKSDKGDLQHWVLELGAPTHMTRAGWAKDSIKPGDEIAAETHPAKSGATVGTTGMQSSVLKVVVNGVALATK